MLSHAPQETQAVLETGQENQNLGVDAAILLM
jgi:hypothetical protein